MKSRLSGKLRAQRVTQLFTLLVLLGFATSGCLIIPVPKHDSGQARVNINERSSELFVPGTSTRSDVILALGEPDVVSWNECQIAYRRNFVTGVVILPLSPIPGSLPLQGATMFGNLIWIFSFDPSGRLDGMLPTNNPMAFPKLLAPAVNLPLQQNGVDSGWLEFTNSRWSAGMNGYWPKDRSFNVVEPGSLVLTESNLLFKTRSQFANAEPELSLPFSEVASAELATAWLSAPRLVVRTRNGEFNSFDIYQGSYWSCDEAAVKAAWSFLQSRINLTDTSPSVGRELFTLRFQHQEGFEYQGQMDWRELIVLTNGVAFTREMTRPRHKQTGFQEHRYRLQLTAEDLQLIWVALKQNHFMTMTHPSRSQANRLSPHEAGYSLSVRLGSGTKHQLHWAEGEAFIPQFNPLCDQLYGLYWRISRTAPVYSGPFEPGWTPDELSIRP